MAKLSIVIPVFNERNTIEHIISAVEASVIPNIETEIILIDDFSTDGTKEILEKLKIKNGRIKILYNDQNRGKGFSLRKGFAEAGGDFVIIQDADLEYDPREYPKLLEPLQKGEADVVYGSRFMNFKEKNRWFKPYFLANRFLTIFSNILSGLDLTDMETCYKCFTGPALNRIAPCLVSDRFEIEPEITAVIARQKLILKEVPTPYKRRNGNEGKKLGFRDGLEAIWAIIRFNLLHDL